MGVTRQWRRTRNCSARGRAIAQPADTGDRIEPSVERFRAKPKNSSSKTVKPADAGDSASPEIPFVVLYAVRFQKSYELVSGRFFLMMLFL